MALYKPFTNWRWITLGNTHCIFTVLGV